MKTPPPSSLRTTTLEPGVGFALEVPGLDLPSAGDFWEDDSVQYGQFAAVREVSPGVVDAVRDPLGIGKLFYTAGDRGLEFSRTFGALLGRGTPVFSLPRGYRVRLTEDGGRTLVRRLTGEEGPLKAIRDFTGAPETFVVQEAGRVFQASVRRRLDGVFSAIRGLEDEGATVFIALSGGLDSSIIASQAHRFLKDPVACTLDLGRSEDAEKSALIARDLGIRHVVFQTSPEEILDAVAQAPALCQDFRDFNVHCAALNLLLARNIASYADAHGVPRGRRIVLTGDLMNEYTNDYAEEVIDGHRYYRLPRVEASQLQSHLIGGLDTSDRELLPFLHHGITCLQPYSAVADLYAAVPGPVLEQKDVKRMLNSFLVVPQILEHLPKSKLRAQVGSKESMGVLGLCHARKIDETVFLNALLGPGAARDQIPLFMGRYQTEEFL